MGFENLLHSVNDNTLHSLRLFEPELALCATIVLMLLLRMCGPARRISPLLVALVGSGVALALAIRPWAQAGSLAVGHQELFTGMLVFDSFTVYFRIVLLAFVVLFAVFTWLSGIPDRDAAQDVFPLVLGATLGMCLMVSANHLLIVFLGVEMASVPSYVLAGLVKGRKKASEAALKYAVYGAGTAGIMLYGISLLGGVLGSFHLPTLAVRLSEMLGSDSVRALGVDDKPLVLMLGGLMLMVGLAFKLSAVPFHFWCPDVFEALRPRWMRSFPSRRKPPLWPCWCGFHLVFVPCRPKSGTPHWFPRARRRLCTRWPTSRMGLTSPAGRELAHRTSAQPVAAQKSRPIIWARPGISSPS